MNRTTAFQSLHDIGAAAWFGGSLMGAIGLNAAADAVVDPAERDQVASAGWNRWTPVFRAAAVAHLLGSVGLLWTERNRASTVKLAITTMAVGAQAGTVVLGSRDSKQAVHALEWAIPALMAAVVLVGAQRDD